jgi:hypothetical protein
MRSARPSAPAINQTINLASCLLSARDDRLCRTMVAQSRRTPARSYGAHAVASEVLHAMPPANDSIAVRDTLVLSNAPFVVQFNRGHAEPDVLRGALISVAIPR